MEFSKHIWQYLWPYVTSKKQQQKKTYMYDFGLYMTRTSIYGFFKAYMTVPWPYMTSNCDIICLSKICICMISLHICIYVALMTAYMRILNSYMCATCIYDDTLMRHICNQKPPLSIYGSYMQLNCIYVSHTFLQRLHICCIYTYMLHICGIYDIFSGDFRPCTQNKV